MIILPPLGAECSCSCHNCWGPWKPCRPCRPVHASRTFPPIHWALWSSACACASPFASPRPRAGPGRQSHRTGPASALLQEHQASRPQKRPSPTLASGQGYVLAPYRQWGGPGSVTLHAPRWVWEYVPHTFTGPLPSAFEFQVPILTWCLAPTAPTAPGTGPYRCPDAKLGPPDPFGSCFDFVLSSISIPNSTPRLSSTTTRSPAPVPGVSLTI